MKGYWRKPAATAEIFVDTPLGRWMRTGDIAYVDAQGRFFIVDRLKELIKVKGNQVAPAELEAVLLEHPQLQDACVVGVTIRGEEVPRAYVVPKEGEAVEGQQVAGWLAERVSRYKRLSGGVVLVDAVPKNPVSLACRKFILAIIQYWLSGLTCDIVWKDSEKGSTRAGEAGGWRQRCRASEVIDSLVICVLLWTSLGGGVERRRRSSVILLKKTHDCLYSSPYLLHPINSSGCPYLELAPLHPHPHPYSHL